MVYAGTPKSFRHMSSIDEITSGTTELKPICPICSGVMFFSKSRSLRNLISSTEVMSFLVSILNSWIQLFDAGSKKPKTILELPASMERNIGEGEEGFFISGLAIFAGKIKPIVYFSGQRNVLLLV